MLEQLVKAMSEQGREASLVLYLLTTLVGMAFALHKEWLVLGKTAKRNADDGHEKDKALAAVNEKLVEQRILNERATVTIDALKERVRDLEIDLARAEGREWQSQRERPKR